MKKYLNFVKSLNKMIMGRNKLFHQFLLLLKQAYKEAILYFSLLIVLLFMIKFFPNKRFILYKKNTDNILKIEYAETWLIAVRYCNEKHDNE
jgi:hypothetical protein